jgi:uncharacterized protein
MSREIAEALVDKVCQSVQANGLRKIAFRVAGGEPLLNVGAFKHLVEYSDKRLRRELGIAFQLAVISNGTLLDREWVQFFNRYSVDVAISMDGLAVEHDKARPLRNGKGSHQMIMRGIQACLDGGILPSILITITPDNVAGIPEFSRSLIDAGLPFRYSLPKGTLIDPQAREHFISNTIQAIEESYTYFEQALLASSHLDFVHLLGDMDFPMGPRTAPCGAGSYSASVDCAGNLAFCQMVNDEAKIGGVELAKDILEQIRGQQYMPDVQTLAPECSACLISNECAGGCPVTRHLTHGTATAPSPYCEVWKALFPKVIRLRALRILKANVRDSHSPSPMQLQ